MVEICTTPQGGDTNQKQWGPILPAQHPLSDLLHSKIKQFHTTNTFFFTILEIKMTNNLLTKEPYLQKCFCPIAKISY